MLAPLSEHACIVAMLARKEPTTMVLKKPFFKNWEDFMEKHVQNELGRQKSPSISDPNPLPPNKIYTLNLAFLSVLLLEI